MGERTSGLLYASTLSQMLSRLSLANKRNRGEKTMHHHTGSSPIIYTMEELRKEGEKLPIIKGFEKAYVRAGDEDKTKKYNDIVDEINSRKEDYQGKHPEATEEEITMHLQSQEVDVLDKVLEPSKGKHIRGMGRAGQRDLSLSSNARGSTSSNRPPTVDEQQLQEVREHYEQRLKETQDLAKQQIEEVQQRGQQLEAVQSQLAAVYAHLGMTPSPPPQYPPQASPP